MPVPGKPIGHRHGRLTIIGPSMSVSHRGYRATMYKVKCDCGTEKVLQLSKTLKSCGCALHDVMDDKDFAINVLYSTHLSMYKNHSVKKSELTKEQYGDLIQKNCHYCGSGPSNKKRKFSKRQFEFHYNGIDRVDNSKNYSIENVVTCCARCNIAKGDQTLEEFKIWLRRIYSHMKLGETSPIASNSALVGRIVDIPSKV